MQWQSRKRSTKGVITTGTITKAALRLLPEILSEFCSYLEESQKLKFEVADFNSWLQRNRDDVYIYSGDRLPPEFHTEGSGKLPLNPKEVCWIFGGAENNWVETAEKPARRITLFKHLKTPAHYELSKDWRKMFVDNSIIEISAPVRTLTQGAVRKDIPIADSATADDYLQNYKKNQEVGQLGEEFVISFEKERLRNGGRADLSGKIRHISKEEGNAAGYDILSFDLAGKKIHVEVKTTTANENTPFFVTANELLFSRQHPQSYRLYRVFGFNLESKTGRLFRTAGPIDSEYDLEAITYKAQR